MSEVKRYEQMFLDPASGQMTSFCVVQASDYDALAAECERLRGTLAAAQRVTLAVCDERDAALAELAALKGGREAVAMLRYARSVPGFENEMPHVVSCNDMPDGLYPVYLAPPAQASAWVPIESAPKNERILLGRVGHPWTFVGKWSEQYAHWSVGGGAMDYFADPSHWQPCQPPQLPAPAMARRKNEPAP